MSTDDERKTLRIHVGNISESLYQSPQDLKTRMAKFGEIVGDYEFHTKPLGDHYFGFVTMNLTSKELDGLKNALHGVQFKGKKLSLNIARDPGFKKFENEREDPQPFNNFKGDKVARARSERIKENQSQTRINSFTSGLLTTSYFNPNNTSHGYMKSSHTFANREGNTKNKAPQRSLIGAQSYGAWTSLGHSPTAQQYSRLSGGGEVIKGRHRISERPKSHFIRREQTLRILINGELKQIKCYKAKLWGIEKDITANDLTYRYQNGTWRTGNDHILERYDDTRNSREVESKPDATTEEALSDDEKLKNKLVLASLFNEDVFSKPVELDNDPEEVEYDSRGKKVALHYDFETLGNLESETKFDMEHSKAERIMSQYKSEVSAPVEDSYYNEDDEDDEYDDFSINEHSEKENYDRDVGDKENGEKEYKEEDNKEVSPSDTRHHNVLNDSRVEADTVPAQKTNDLDTLRNLFNSEDKTDNSGGFKLMLSDEEDDIDKERAPDLEEQSMIVNQVKLETQSDRNTRGNYGLFWIHDDSPFLSAQTQLRKLEASSAVLLPGESSLDQLVPQGEETPYEKWFWSMRGELTRDSRKRRRDVLRGLRKKKAPVRAPL